MLAAAALIFLLQDAPPPATAEQLADCIRVATSSPEKGEAYAARWRGEGGGYRARQCLGVAYANQDRWAAAADAFEDAAREAEAAKDPLVAEIWAQAGNAWLASGEAGKAKLALDAALARGTLEGKPLGETYLDRARAREASGDLEGARADLDRAIEFAPDVPLGWLLSATLARRMGDRRLAKAHIDEALRRDPENPSVQLEAGNVAVVMGDEATARSAWQRVLELAPGSPQANAARAALGQFGAEQ